MTEVIRVALHAKVLGPWDSDCAGGRLLSTDTGLADLLPLGVLNTSAQSILNKSSCLNYLLPEERSDCVIGKLRHPSILNCHMCILLVLRHLSLIMPLIIIYDMILFSFCTLCCIVPCVVCLFIFILIQPLGCNYL